MYVRTRTPVVLTRLSIRDDEGLQGASALVDFQAHRICLQRTELDVRPNSEVRIRHFTCGVMGVTLGGYSRIIGRHLSQGSGLGTHILTRMWKTKSEFLFVTCRLW
jgi:hypothetical protein